MIISHLPRKRLLLVSHSRVDKTGTLVISRILRLFWQIMLMFVIQATLANWSQNDAEFQSIRNRRPNRTPPDSLKGAGEVLAGAFV
jgi:hypothetical protein